MWFKLKLWWNNPAENLWFTPALGALLAIFFSLFATASRYFIPSHAVPNISIETLSSLLDIIASSMLAVTTFSLSIMVAAFASASSSGTPRAYKLMMNDDNTRLAITSFISAFIYAVIAKIALGLQYYGVSGRFVLFVSTILVLIYLIVTLIRWVQTLSQLGTLTNAISKIETAASQALSTFRTHPNFGASGQKPLGESQLKIHPKQTGYFTHFDIESLNLLAQTHNAHIHLALLPGKFVDPSLVLIEVFTENPIDDEELKNLEHQIHEYVVIETNRSFLQDPRFGLLVMSEVGQKAMSAAINDVGSAISAINALTRIIIDSQPDPEQKTFNFSNISVDMFDIREFVSSSFAPMARDCISNIELNQRIIKCLSMIKKNVSEPELREAAHEMAHEILARCLKHFEFEPDRQRLIREYENNFS
ncbi:DUF2254 domain-containing protein [Acinetobacter sp. YH16032]|uniref:DUF2254 domain-containing protein n=1 Tax=Acinetobacter sp. YH16032 TaxID=2601181 RepID=UPI0015D3289A|nr:DUF2254 family protein [Acinetobacter sp. YH16032]